MSPPRKAKGFPGSGYRPVADSGKYCGVIPGKTNPYAKFPKGGNFFTTLGPRVEHPRVGLRNRQGFGPPGKRSEFFLWEAPEGL